MLTKQQIMREKEILMEDPLEVLRDIAYEIDEGLPWAKLLKEAIIKNDHAEIGRLLVKGLDEEAKKIVERWDFVN